MSGDEIFESQFLGGIEEKRLVFLLQPRCSKIILLQTSRPLCNGLVPHNGEVGGRRGGGDHLCPVEGEGEGGRRCLEKVNGGGDGSDDDGGEDVDDDDFPPRVVVGVGDRVAGYIPNCPEAIIAMAATAALGEFTFFFVITVLSS